LLAAAATNRMVDNASELPGRLSALNPQNVTVVRTVFSGELHSSVPYSSLVREIRFYVATKLTDTQLESIIASPVAPLRKRHSFGTGEPSARHGLKITRAAGPRRPQ